VSIAPVVVLTGMTLEARIAVTAAKPVGAGDTEVLFGLRGEALSRVLAERLQRPCAGLISFGMAGGLASDLPAGTIIIAHGIATPTGLLQTDPTWTATLHATLPTAVSGVLAGVDAPVTAAADKASMRQASGALAADMESHIGARLARHAGVPFAACRVIVDPAEREVPPAAVAGFGADGGVALAPLLRELLRHPGQLPALLRLASDAGKAREALRQVRAELGERFGR
jgi:hopanoid-associated phosphorylase